jgi:leader peptidase (prepilin peptidase)/N-methyltransferase
MPNATANAVTIFEAIKSTPALSTAWILRLVRALSGGAIWTGLILAIVAAAAISVSILNAPGVAGILGACLALLMLTIAAIDWRSFIIPDRLNAAGFCLGLLHSLVLHPDAMPLAVALAATRGAVLALLFLALRYLYARVRGRQGLGLGDIKLAAVAGAWLDWAFMPIAVEIAAFAGLTIYVVRQFLLGRPISASTRLPFGLFFAPAIWICWLIETILWARL